MEIQARRPTFGALLTIASACCYATIPTLGKVAYGHGTSALGVLVMRCVISVPIVLTIVVWRHGLGFATAAARRALLPSLVFCAQSLCFFSGLEHAGAVTTVLLLFTYPLFVTIAGVVLFHRRLGRGQGFSVVAGSLGVWLSVGFGGSGSTLGVGLGLASGVLFAVFLLMAERTIDAGVDGLTLTAVLYTVMGLVYLTIAAIGGVALPVDSSGWTAVVVIALLGTAGGTVLLLVGMEHVSAATAAMLSVTEPPVAVILAAVALQERIRPTQIGGMALVMLALIVLGHGLTRPVDSPVPTP